MPRTGRRATACPANPAPGSVAIRVRTLFAPTQPSPIQRRKELQSWFSHGPLAPRDGAPDESGHTDDGGDDEQPPEQPDHTGQHEAGHKNADHKSQKSSHGAHCNTVTPRRPGGPRPIHRKLSVGLRTERRERKIDVNPSIEPDKEP